MEDTKIMVCIVKLIRSKSTIFIFLIKLKLCGSFIGYVLHSENVFLSVDFLLLLKLLKNKCTE